MAIPVTANVITALIPIPPADRVKLLDEADKLRRQRRTPRVDLTELDEAKENLSKKA